MAITREQNRTFPAPRACDGNGAERPAPVLRAVGASPANGFEHSAEMRDASAGIIGVLTRAVQFCDPHTHGHQERVSVLAGAIGEELGLDANTILGIRYGALVHDIGKIGIPGQLLTTARKLSLHELAIVRTHPVVGAEIIRNARFPWPVLAMVLQHHERLDGSGYPEGLMGSAILFEARIIGVADVVEAMTHHRPYRAALGLQAGLAEVINNRGTLYDADVVDACVAVMERSEGQFWTASVSQALMAAL